MPRLRLAFLGTPDFAVSSLDALLSAGHEMACVYCQPPRPSGRGHKMQPSPVQTFAERHGLPVRSPKSLKPAEAQAEFRALDLDVAVVAAYGLILPQVILDAPRHGCLNVHASLLPRWRGAAPIQRAIQAGDTETGITIMQMDAGLDTGAMLHREAVPIDGRTTAAALHTHLAALGGRLIVTALEDLAAGRLEPMPQPADKVTYAAKLERDEGRLDWQADAAVLDRQVRAFTPWPGAWFEAGDGRIKVLEASPQPSAGSPAPPGAILAPDFTVACGHGSLRLIRVQRAGRAAVDGTAFLRGSALQPGQVLATAAT